MSSLAVWYTSVSNGTGNLSFHNYLSTEWRSKVLEVVKTKLTPYLY